VSGSPYADCMWFRASIRLYLGELTIQAARAETERALAMALEHPDAVDALGAYVALIGICSFEGDGEAALEHAARAVELAERAGGLWAQSQAHSERGQAHVLRGEWNEAIAAETRSLELARTFPAGMLWEPAALAQLANAYLGAGDAERARDAAEQAVAISAKGGSRLIELWAQVPLVSPLIGVQATHASAELDPGARAEIERALGRAETLIQELGAKSVEPFLHELRARLAQLTGDTPRYVRELTEAQRQFAEMGADPQAARLSAELAPAAT
jgi:tetratricopeptide (TPR) repeat protein